MTKIVLSGVETNNKGAELMLYGILQEIERQFPDAVVYIARNMVKQGLGYINSPVKMEYIPDTFSPLINFCDRLKITAILNRVGCYSRYLNHSNPIADANYFIDGSGLLFSDKRISSKLTAIAWSKKLSGYKNSNTTIVFLPQAFGPFKKTCSRATIKALDKYADVIFARESVSFDYLNQIVTNKDKVKLFPDFTSLVEGTFPERLQDLIGRVCIIPNTQMIKKGVLTKDCYFSVLDDIIATCTEQGHRTYFLNHEGIKDEELTKEYISSRKSNIEIVSGLNALEVKGLISTAYLVISSRFHGVASSLNGFVPCLATSWHHKYAELFRDFGLSDCILSLDDRLARKQKIIESLDPENNARIRLLLESRKEQLVQRNKEMWNLIWNLK